jgi:hypothetical protein
MLLLGVAHCICRAKYSVVLPVAILLGRISGDIALASVTVGVLHAFTCPVSNSSFFRAPPLLVLPPAIPSGVAHAFACPGNISRGF